ncbi:PKD domain-containing protein [Aestuariibacter sp. AA17]|uniref:PKD domain-containing protein n=1 Tax=Fluctibacter corallii TaxID=2984329 RepID=A0ABT3ACG7_9ALTE|nr:PKD domain-containing protein [Aestuariibacter sp. AA17]MCV2886369.1 PKD domain-containing protein [Aestuariibacter sp. AA17]
MRYLKRFSVEFCLIVLFACLLSGHAHSAVDETRLTLLTPDQFTLEYGDAEYNRRTGKTSYDIAVTNSTTLPLQGPVYMVVSGFGNDATLDNADDMTTSGQPVIRIDETSWQAGEVLQFTLIWTLASRQRLNFVVNPYVVPDIPLPEITSFSASSNNIVLGQSVELSWTTSNAESVSIAPAIGVVDNNGSYTVTPPGTTVYTLTATNGTGSANASQTIVVSPLLKLSIRATPESGFAPISIRFSPLTDTFTAIERYRWDFNGDGNFDRTDTVGRDQTYYYASPGQYTVLLEALASDGTLQTATYDLDVTNQPPVVNASVNVTNGEVPLAVSFFASATDSNGIALYEWDFDNDGSIDYSSTSSGNTGHVFNDAGNYQARVIVTDNEGAQTETALPNIEIRALPAGSPSVTMSLSRISGTAPLSVNFNGIVDADPSVSVVSWNWDFDGDGTTDSQDASPSHVYTSAGVFFPALEVVMSDGQTAIDIRKVTVNATEPRLYEVNDHTLSTDIGDVSQINTRLYSDTDIQLQIEDVNNQVVSVLIPWQLRTSGNYVDAWDGTDASGNPMPEGQYYAVLLYKENDVELRVDLRDSTGGRQYNPSRTRIPSRFSPFDNDPLDITFTLQRPSEVTAFMGLFRTNTRLVTFLQRQPLGAGSYTIYWNGEAPNGEIVEPIPGNPFLFGIWGWELADNVIYVKNAPQLSGLTVLPGILDPTSNNAIKDGNSKIRFTLSKDASIEVTVASVDSGSEVAHRYYANQAAGTVEVLWDGKGDDDDYLAPGSYRIAVNAVDSNGVRSMSLFGMQRIYY